MTLLERITDDMKSYMKAKDTVKLGAVRMLIAAIKQVAIDKRIEMTDAEVMAVIEKECKKRNDSAAAYNTAGRQDLEAAELFELELFKVYLPQRASAEEVDAAITEGIMAARAEGKEGPKAMGAVISYVKTKLAGRIDVGAVSATVKGRL